jgi:hypothetical protein
MRKVCKTWNEIIKNNDGITLKRVIKNKEEYDFRYNVFPYWKFGVGQTNLTDLTKLPNWLLDPNIITLNLSGRGWLSNVDGLATAPSLHTLNLSGCGGLTNVDGLATAPSLHNLNLAGCGGLTNVDGLATAPSLHTLNLSG